MHPGFRYHLASLMAVFLSLVLGILVGAVLFQDSALVEEQGLIISEMEQHFGNLQANLINLEKELAFNEKGWKQLRDRVTKDLLSESAVYLLELEHNWDWGPIEKALQAAGAQTSILKIDELEHLEALEDRLLLMNCGVQGFSQPILTQIGLLRQGGAHFTFVWTTEYKPPLFSVPSGLQIDCVNTVWGEIALILGLASKATGHYGVLAEAQGLFP